MSSKITSILCISVAVIFVGYYGLFSSEKSGRELIYGGGSAIASDMQSIHKTGTLQLPFISNVGQYAEEVAFYASTFAANAFVTRNGEITYCLFDGNSEHKFGWAVKEHLVGSNPISIKGEERLPGLISSFRGKNPSKWVNNAATFRRVNLGIIYDGIELKLCAYGNNIEKLFYVYPGANPEKIQMRFDGAENLAINDAGELEIGTGSGLLAFTRPVAYQENGDKKECVEIAYEVNEDSYGFIVGDYDRSRTLVIDPLLASTYLGGSGNEGNVLSLSMVLDDEGNVYVAGRTISTDFPYIAGAYNEENNGNYDIFISKLTGDLTTLLASTYFGGNYIEGERGSPDLILDDDGNVYVTGITNSVDFPTIPGCYNDEPSGNYDIFISKLSNNLDSLLASTYFGSVGFEQVNSIALDGSGNVFIGGYTRRFDFPVTPGAFQETYYGTGGMQWGGEVFISKFSSDLSTLMASTFLGGSDWDEGGYLAIDNSDNVYVVGHTRSGTPGSSVDFPTTEDSYCPDYNGDYQYGGDAFVSLLSNDLTNLIASTYLGGNSNDWGYGIVLDDYGDVYVTGHTPSPDFPTTPGAYDEDYNSPYGSDGGNDLYVSKFSPDLSTLLASTFHGSMFFDVTLEIDLDSDGNVYVGGHTNTTLFPTTPGCYDDSFNGGNFEYGGDIIIVCFNPDLSVLKSSSFFGGSGQEDIGSMVIDPDNNLYLAGFTNSSDFPIIPGAYQEDYHGGSVDQWGGDAFISIIPAVYFYDPDGDNIPGPSDNCPDTYNPEQEDTDLDGVGDSCDNCIDVYNPNQEDEDQNGVGDLCQYICGDANNDGIVNILDITFLIANLYKSGPPPESEWAADPNGDGIINLLDITYLISSLYKDGPDPACL